MYIREMVLGFSSTIPVRRDIASAVATVIVDPGGYDMIVYSHRLYRCWTQVNTAYCFVPFGLSFFFSTAFHVVVDERPAQRFRWNWSIELYYFSGIWVLRSIFFHQITTYIWLSIKSFVAFCSPQNRWSWIPSHMVPQISTHPHG